MATSELRWAIVQRRVVDDQVESVVAAFQHRPLAVTFLEGLHPIAEHYLALEDSEAVEWAGPVCNMCNGTGVAIYHATFRSYPARCVACNGHGRDPE